MCILAHILTAAMLTAMTSLYVAPCESGPPVFLITLGQSGIVKLRTTLRFLPDITTSLGIHAGAPQIRRGNFWALTKTLRWNQSSSEKKKLSNTAI